MSLDGIAENAGPIASWAVAVAGGTTAVVGGFRHLRPVYERARARQRAEEQLQRLAVKVRSAYFTSILGEHAMESERGGLRRRIYVDRWFYVASYERESSVVAYFVTTRHERFRPRLQVTSGPVVQLGVTTPREFTASPTSVVGWVGARRAGYLEASYGGNPSHYLTFLVGMNDAGGEPSVDPMVTVFFEGGPFPSWSSLGRSDAELADFLHHPEVVRMRSTGRVNTFGVADWASPPDDLGLWGVNLDEVRVLPQWLEEEGWWKKRLNNGRNAVARLMRSNTH